MYSLTDGREKPVITFLIYFIISNTNKGGIALPICVIISILFPLNTKSEGKPCIDCNSFIV